MWREDEAVKPGAGTSVGRSERSEDAGVGSVWENWVAEMESGRRYRLIYKTLHPGNLIGWYFSMLDVRSY